MQEKVAMFRECPTCVRRGCTLGSLDFSQNEVCPTCNIFPMNLAFPLPALLKHQSSLEKKYAKKRDSHDLNEIRSKYIEKLLTRLEALQKKASRELLRTKGVKLLIKLYGWLVHLHRNNGNSLSYKARIKAVEASILMACHELRHPELTQFDPKWVAKDVREVRAEGPLSWSMSLLTPEYCDLLVDEMRSYKEANPFANFDLLGIYLNELGFKDFFEKLAGHLTDVARQKSKNVTLTYNTAYVIRYHQQQQGPLAGHPKHDDKTDLTINLRIDNNTELEGGDLQLETPLVWDNKDADYPSVPMEKQLAPAAPVENEYVYNPFAASYVQTCPVPPGYRSYSITPKPYRAVVHPGELHHSSTPVTKGERIHLIVWLNASHSFERFMDLDPEIQQMILEFCGPAEISAFSQCSHKTNKMIKESAHWKNLFREIFGEWNPECDKQELKGGGSYFAAGLSHELPPLGPPQQWQFPSPPQGDTKEKEKKEKEEKDVDWKERFRKGPLSFLISNPEPVYNQYGPRPITTTRPQAMPPMTRMYIPPPTPTPYNPYGGMPPMPMSRMPPPPSTPYGQMPPSPTPYNPYNAYPPIRMAPPPMRMSRMSRMPPWEMSRPVFRTRESTSWNTKLEKKKKSGKCFIQ